jgi:transcription antitermination protein NusB
MLTRTQTRRQAMRLLYQIDMQGSVDLDALKQFLTDEEMDPRTREEALALALAAWGSHKKADELYVRLAPQWPTHRLAPIDRAILRLAYYEFTAGLAPGPVLANEAVLIAKEYSGQNSPGFVNNLVDRMTKTSGLQKEAAPSVEHKFSDADTSPASSTAASSKAKAWLDDAVDESKLEIEKDDDIDNDIPVKKPRRSLKQPKPPAPPQDDFSDR